MGERQKKRSEIDEAYKWRIEDIFVNDAAWREEFDRAERNLDALKKYRGQLNDSRVLARCLSENDKISETMERLYVYATMRLHENSGDSFYQGLAEQAENLAVKIMAEASFIAPEILRIDRRDIERHMDEDVDLAKYRHYFDELFRSKEHILDTETERLLAEASEIGSAPDNIFSMLNDADMKFGFVKDKDGRDVELTHGKFTSFMESRDRMVRKAAFETYYDAFFKLKNTIAATYGASVKKDVFFAKSRKYASSLDAALFAYNIPKDVYTSLIAAVNEFLPALRGYIKLRKKTLGVDELHMYDLYTPIVADADTSVSYQEAKTLALEAFSPLGAEYSATVARALENGWIDVYENEGKRGGAYAWGAYGAHPYILLNFDNKINDAFTLAHEMGHAMHSYYTWETQPYVYADYTIFVAEVASTVNERLFMEHLLKKTDDATMRAYLINYFLEQFRGTVFRQTMFAEFEMKTHEMSENGEPLTVETLSSLYRGLNEKYYGDGITIDSRISLEWARIPHFYNAFYVYQYATGFSAAVALSERILTEGEPAVNDYINFLKSGSSDYSINLLKKAGVDMSSPEPVRKALEKFAELCERLKDMLNA